MDKAKRQLAKKRQLLQMKRILDDMGVGFWLHSGVLLGYYRERDLILHDPDLDIGVLEDSLPDDFAGKLARRLENTGMHLFWKTKTCLKVATDDGLSHCDIFIHSGSLGEEGLSLELEDENHSVRYEYPIRGFVKTKFLGAEFAVPSNPKEILFKQYGPSWKIPREEFQWDRDPCNIAGKPTLVLDETPSDPVLSDVPECKFAAVFGPLTVADAGLLSKKCGKAVVFSEQPGMSIRNVEFVRCDETHGAAAPLEHMKTKPDAAIVVQPKRHSEDNMRTMLETAWKHLPDGGKLVFESGKPPVCVSEFMFRQTGKNSFEKYAESKNWEENVTAIVVTYESPDMAEKCVASIKKFHPGIRIVLADNSANPHKVAGTRFLAMPEDSGLAACRNAALLEVHTPFVLLTDDDQILEDAETARKLHDSLRKNDLDIVGGMTVNSSTGVPAMYFGKIERKPESVRLVAGNNGEFPDGTEKVDLTLNFFVAKTDALLKTKWTPELKVCEHLDFFMRAQDLGLKIGHRQDAKCRHEKGPGVRGPGYMAQRRRTEFHRNLMMRLNGLSEVVQFHEKPYKYKPGQPVRPEQPKTQEKRSFTLPQYQIPRPKSLFELRPDLFKRKK